MLQNNWQALIKPHKLVVSFLDPNLREAEIVAEPLERGYGMTLGNTLRRILLSSLQGAAITSIKVDGVLHEFSTIPGVMEDVADIILNLKMVGVRSAAETPKRLKLNVTEKGPVYARQIECPADVEILDPDLKKAQAETQAQQKALEDQKNQNAGAAAVTGTDDSGKGDLVTPDAAPPVKKQ